MKLHLYSIEPIDFWYGTQHAQLFLNKLSVSTNTAFSEEGEIYDISAHDFKVLWQHADEALEGSRLGWEGDGVWRFICLPDPDCCSMHIVFFIKQSNNGTTFVVSPVELPYLMTSGGIPGATHEIAHPKSRVKSSDEHQTRP